MRFLGLLLLVHLAVSIPTFNFDDDRFVHPEENFGPRARVLPGEETADYWIANAQETVQNKLNTKINTNKAKNVILFLGDGMSISTVTAGRIYAGQLNGEAGEEGKLSFEQFPYSGLSKTYCVDSQVADSACSATAYLTGVKGNRGTVGVTAAVERKNCESSVDPETHSTSIARWSQLANKRTGIVTTTRVTHASPTGAYASIAERHWECDKDVERDDADPTVCRDIAWQLINGETGKNFNVIMGGGRSKLIPFRDEDEEGKRGERRDGLNLIEEWQTQKEGENAAYVWNRTGLLNIPEDTDYLLGLFASSHTPFHLDASEEDPSLTEMTEAAINVLSKSDEGYFLFVEGGRIDHGHHATWAQRALDETAQFSEAIQRAREITDEEDTLIIVTSDHSHTMTISGYAPRGNDIFSLAGKGYDRLPYATLSYANGFGYRKEKDGKRHDLNEDDMHKNWYFFPSLTPKFVETHAGEDVGIFASGPQAHLFSGVVEQNVIPHLMAYASCVGDGLTACDTK